MKIRPKPKGKDIIAVGDQNIEFSSDYGKTWKTISQEKKINLMVLEWIRLNLRMNYYSLEKFYMKKKNRSCDLFASNNHVGFFKIAFIQNFIRCFFQI